MNDRLKKAIEAARKREQAGFDPTWMDTIARSYTGSQIAAMAAYRGRAAILHARKLICLELLALKEEKA